MKTNDRVSAHYAFFKIQIFDFYKNDMETCLQISEQKRERATHISGGLNFTVALVVLCVLETVAAFYKGKRKTSAGRMREASSDDVADFLVKYFGPRYPLFQKKDFSKKFFEVFRHGLVHQFTPKASGVGMEFYNPNPVVTFRDGNKHGEELMGLNIPPFFSLSLLAYNDFRLDLDQGLYLDEFNQHYKDMVSCDYAEMRLLRRLFLQYMPL